MSVISYILGGIDKHLILFITIIISDFLTNFCLAFYNKTIKKFINRKTVIKYLGYILILIFASVIDIIMQNTNMIRNTLIYFFIANEGMNIMENWSKMGLPLPHKIFTILNELKEEEDGKETPSPK